MAGRREPPPTAGGELFTKTSGRGSRKGGWLKLVKITFYGISSVQKDNFIVLQHM